jgi:hypothetical protein
MDTSEQARFDGLYAQHLRALRLQGKAAATVDGYARAVRRVAAHFDRCPGQLSGEDYKTYFDSLIARRSWSLVTIERCGLEFFHRHVLEREWPWVNMGKPPGTATLRPQIANRDSQSSRCAADVRDGVPQWRAKGPPYHAAQVDQTRNSTRKP